ncbi:MULTISPECIES: carbamoyl phosphate synthase small subunit [Breznakia]|uniref:Carbamoyl phosphate synthase small chain n=1 Tax=Breznakia blatticola TaxID=1754012 RepID=A0A4R7Z8P1_9FIRM|nr:MULTISPECIES: carbamoyl phosphate synthase small subunit [Breznakia]MDH6367231.1 carbamoyl-phosphate synthase small subunit [Breznakia sp. PH1-1]MDH6404349.1 carbamoyl-phosphate synthase small subunit [Breznakia sp. PF1-11]MDH6412058.1 carbamoyl-phosphate synthase small subunit [Breznakia sp. PFB1-11]MDH6414337.1 carbamoyl-phosphate synthase small subunit [Breznakia sp. PFB1-14]MDH6416733.1 carbamoyl-phosphate synthase small subunit [Breznakia sp. PFB1-4]
MKRQLILEDGSVFVGEGFGGSNYQMGEIVFNTGMSGYQEVISDLSYCAQIVLMTYPMIGNYGINRDDFESIEPAIFGLVVSEYCEYPNNWRSDESIDTFLASNDIPGLAGIDTRKLTKLIRKEGTMKAIMADMDVDVDATVAMLKAAPYPTGQVAQVSTQKAFQVPNRGRRVVLIDYGAKQGIVRELSSRGCDLKIMPYTSTVQEVMNLKPDGIMLSNGPGDPRELTQAIENIRALIGQIPIFGICLGHQLIALASGAKIDKLKFGHRGANQPVMNLLTGKVEITSQNHSFSVNEESLANTDLEVTHRNLNDKSVEGLACPEKNLFSVQYHPEAAPGPEDANYLFDTFMRVMDAQGGNK